jgi:hypothetical protein
MSSKLIWYKNIILIPLGLGDVFFRFGNCYNWKSISLLSLFSKKVFFLLIPFLLFSNPIFSETIHGTIDTVYNFKQGIYIDQDSINPYFPQNIFGEPSKIGSETIPASSYEEIQSLGMGGEIIVGFKNKLLINGPGADFTIFENAFINPINNGYFAEPGKIAVSRDGITYYVFKYDSTNLKGLAGISPTFSDKDPFNPSESGGDAFDLSDVGIDTITYIKITDFTSIITTLSDTNKFWNPEFILSGFDLDAVVGLYLTDAATSVNEKNKYSKPYILISNFDGNYQIINVSINPIQIKLIDIQGNIIEKSNIQSFYEFSSEIINSGIYFVVIETDKGNYINKIVIAK